MAGWEAFIRIGDVVDAALLVVIALAGAALLFVKPRSSATLALALFMVGYGTAIGLFHWAAFVADVDIAVAMGYVAVPFLLLASASVLALALRFPRPVPAAGRRGLWFAGVAALAYAARSIMDVYYVLKHDIHYASWDFAWTHAIAAGVVYTWAVAALCFFLVALGVRCRVLGLEGDLDGARSAALVAVTMVPVAAVILVGAATDEGLIRSGGWSALYAALAAPLLLVLLATWTYASHGVPPALRRRARNVVLVAVVFGMASFGLRWVPELTAWVLALARTLGLTVLVYAILRQQLFDIDIKVKWTLSRGAVAGVFLAVFFVAAQLAQNFLSDKYGWALGGIAAGVLLFAIAPIQRMAEQLSDKAMPEVRPHDPTYVLRCKRETYRNAYATAWGDGNLTPKDMRMLHQVREALGLPEKEILAIEKDWAKATA